MGRPACFLDADYEHPEAYAFKKHAKSLAVSVGEAVLWSQFAYESPDAYRFRKQAKSFADSTGETVESSQLA